MKTNASCRSLTPRAFAKRSGWRACLACAALTAAVTMTGAVSWAQTTTAPAVSQVNHAAALQAFRQARVLYGQNDFSGANVQNNRALQLDPALTDAQLLRKVLQEKMGAGSSAPTSAGPSANGTTPMETAPKVKVLTQSQLSMIRLQELSDADTQIRGHIPQKALTTFWDTYIKVQPGADLSQTAYNNFISPNNFVAQVRAIKDANMPEIAESLDITSDPADMVAFRTTVHPYILQNCATSACHGGDKAGSFHLLRPGGASLDQVIYTNFYIMSQYQTHDGGQIINRDQPGKSLFLQYGLPRAAAIFAHPGNADVRPRFGDANTPEYQAMVAWVKGLAFPRPNYGIIYEIPGMTPPIPPHTVPAKH